MTLHQTWDERPEVGIKTSVCQKREKRRGIGDGANHEGAGRG